MGQTWQVIYGVVVHSEGVHVINARGAGMHEERHPVLVLPVQGRAACMA